jgi:hypothetical protein
MTPLPRSLLLPAAALLLAATQTAVARPCPPNSHPAPLAMPGNLRTAQCFCDPDFVPVRGRCMRASWPASIDPVKARVRSMPFR